MNSGCPSKKLPYAEPYATGCKRARQAKDYRDLAAEVSRTRAHALTLTNNEESDQGPQYPANFTKGLLHDDCGILKHAEDYRCFVEAINAPDPTLFEKEVETAATRVEDPKELFNCPKKTVCEKKEDVKWRGWESPRAGHVFDLEGPDAGAVGMAPAPRVGSSELAAEMAEVYALALLRDVRFTTICEGGGDKLCGSEKKKSGSAVLSAEEIVALLNTMPFYSGKDITSSTPCNTDGSGFNRFERNRRFARTLSLDGALTTENVFRGSTKGAMDGPYISQFMLIGNDSLACRRPTDVVSVFPGTDARFNLPDGFLR